MVKLSPNLPIGVKRTINHSPKNTKKLTKNEFNNIIKNYQQK